MSIMQLEEIKANKLVKAMSGYSDIVIEVISKKMNEGATGP